MHRWLEMIAARQPVRRVMLDAGLHVLAGAVDYLPRMRQRMAACELIEDVEYVRRGDVGLCLDILKPRGDGPHPVLIYLHGGAFAICSKRTHRALAAAYVCKAMWSATSTIAWPLTPIRRVWKMHAPPGCGCWTTLETMAATPGASHWRASRPAQSRSGGDADVLPAQARGLAAPGVCARGHLPRAALLYCGLLQVSQPERHRRAGVSTLAATIVEDAASSYLGQPARHGTGHPALADPLCLIEAMAGPSPLPPLFIAAGLNDPVLSDSQRLEHALERLGSPCQAHYYPGETHAFHATFWREQALRCWRDSFAFLQHHLRLSPAREVPARQPA